MDKIIKNTIKDAEMHLKRKLTKAEVLFVQQCYDTVAECQTDEQAHIASTNCAFLMTALIQGTLKVKEETSLDGGFYLSSTDTNLRKALAKFGNYVGGGTYHD